MRDAVRELLSAHLEEALGRPLDLTEMTEDTALDALGLDSLLTISTLVDLSEECGVDLTEHADTLETPQALGDLLAITAQFMESR